MRRGFGFHDRHSPFRFDPATLFIGGAVPGAWYDPSDLSALYQDSAGTTPVTTTGQAVGLLLDKSQGLTLGPELVTNGTFDTNVNGWSLRSGSNPTTGGSLTWQNGVAQFARGTTFPSYAAAQQITGLTVGRWYLLTGRMRLVSGVGPVCLQLRSNDGGGGSDLTAPQNSVSSDFVNVRIFWLATATTAWVSLLMQADSSVGQFDDISLRLVPGNHAYQTSSSSRPTYTVASGLSYLALDGSNDSMLTGSIDFTGTDKMTVWAGVTKSIDDQARFFAELSANINLNNGAFAVRAPTGASPSYAWFSKGTSTQIAQVATGYTSPTTNVLTGIGDISGDRSVLRINGAQVDSNTGDQGTGNFGNYPLYIGARGGASSFFSGRLYGLIVLGAAASDWQINVTEQWMAGKTGITI